MSTITSGVMTSRAWCWETNRIRGSGSSVATLSEILSSETTRPCSVGSAYSSRIAIDG